MSASDQGDTALEARLRRLCSRLDAAPHFSARLKARIASLPGPADAALRARLTARAEAERLETAARLRARFHRLVGITIGASAVAAIGARLYGVAAAEHLVTRGQAVDPATLATLSAVLLAAWLWIVARAAARGGRWPALLA